MRLMGKVTQVLAFKYVYYKIAPYTYIYTYIGLSFLIHPVTFLACIRNANIGGCRRVRVPDTRHEPFSIIPFPIVPEFINVC